jgi:single-strand DNA-binding protein
MSNDLNRCEFIGRLGKDPELRYSPAGDAFCNFSIACGWKTKEKDGTEWVRATAFGKLAEICGQYLKKGSQVFIAGRLTTRKWKNKEGVDQYSTEINVDQMQMLGGKSEPDAPPVAKNSQRVASNVEDMDDDIPF